jgi:hypothetical protein
MNKKTFAAAVIMLTLFLSALTNSLFLNLAAANPVGLYYPQSPPPKPIIKLVGLDADKLSFTFSVRKAGPWITPMGSEYWGNYESAHEWNYSVSSIVWVDGKVWCWQQEVTSPITISLQGLINGSHTMKITATASGERYWYTSEASSNPIEFQIYNPSPTPTVIPTGITALAPNPTQTQAQTITPSPSPTPLPSLSSLQTKEPTTEPSLTPTPNASPNPSPSPIPSLSTLTQQPVLEPTLITTPVTDNVQADNYTPTIILASVTAACVAVATLVYLNRRKHVE